MHTERGENLRLISAREATRRKTSSMKKTERDYPTDELLPEYDLSNGVTGKYYERYKDKVKVALLEPDVYQMFPNSEAVNRALRAVGELIKAAGPEAGNRKKRVA